MKQRRQRDESKLNRRPTVSVATRTSVYDVSIFLGSGVPGRLVGALPRCPILSCHFRCVQLARTHKPHRTVNRYVQSCVKVDLVWWRHWALLLAVADTAAADAAAGCDIDRPGRLAERELAAGTKGVGWLTRAACYVVPCRRRRVVTVDAPNTSQCVRARTPLFTRAARAMSLRLDTMIFRLSYRATRK